MNHNEDEKKIHYAILDFNSKLKKKYNLCLFW